MKHSDTTGIIDWRRWTALAVAALFTGLWMAWTPLQADDLAFAHFLDGFISRGSGPLEGWMDYAAWYRADSNGRLANYLAPVVTGCMAPWLFAALTALAAAWILYAVARLGLGGEWTLSGGIALLWLWPLALVLWPWRDYLSYPDYALNYVWSTAFGIAFMWLWLSTGRRISVRLTAAGCLCGLLAGMMHEGIGLPMLAGCGAVALVRRFRLPWQVWLMVLFLAAGTAESALAPGIIARAGREHSAFSPMLNGWIMLKHSTLLIVLAGVCGVMCVRREWRAMLAEIFRDPVFVMAVGNALGGALICFLFDYATPRYGWVTQVYSTVALGVIAARCGWFKGRRGMFAGGVAFLAGCILATGVIVWQKKFYDEETRLRAAMEASPYGTVFSSILTKKNIPLWLLRIPTGGMWQSTFQHRCYNMRYSRPDGRPWAVVPAAPEGFRPESAPVPGNAGAMRNGGYLIGRREPESVEGREFWVPRLVATLADGTSVTLGCEVIPFTADDGCRYVYFGEVELPGNTVKVDYEEYNQ
ncbi:MAG TPA: hypothetical protein DCR26_05420 [Porphyromonadaceae bacterium]|nr:hypothetical protein [Porphyromonadaceae bacterium]